MLKLGLVVAWMGLSLAAAPAQAEGAKRALKAMYMQSCAKCHGLDGSGRTPSGGRLPGRVLTDSKWQAKHSDEAFVKSILMGKGAMPGFKAKLSEADARQLVQEILRPMAARKK